LHFRFSFEPRFSEVDKSLFHAPPLRATSCNVHYSGSIWQWKRDLEQVYSYRWASFLIQIFIWQVLFSRLYTIDNFANFYCDKYICSKATILAKIMWTPNFSNANINIETFFHEICRPLPPIQCCFSHLNFKSFIYQHWIGGRRGINFLGD
jgi:hypothetical protein